MRVFLAGATGAIGRRLVPLLLADGHRVTGMVRSHGPASSSSRPSASPTSPTIALPIGARAASPASQVMCTSVAPSGSSGPGM